MSFPQIEIFTLSNEYLGRVELSNLFDEGFQWMLMSAVNTWVVHSGLLQVFLNRYHAGSIVFGRGVSYHGGYGNRWHRLTCHRGVDDAGSLESWVAIKYGRRTL